MSTIFEEQGETTLKYKHPTRIDDLMIETEGDMKEQEADVSSRYPVSVAHSNANNEIKSQQMLARKVCGQHNDRYKNGKLQPIRSACQFS